jgi:hypothetical protein
MVEERGREPVGPPPRVAVLALTQVPLHDRTELRVEQELAGQAVEQGGEPGDGGGDDDPAGTDDPGRLPQGTDPVGPLAEVVERAQEQDGVDTRPGGGEVADVQDPPGGRGRCRRTTSRVRSSSSCPSPRLIRCPSSISRS